MEKIIKNIRQDFPIFDHFNKKNQPFYYLDNAATTLKPQCVLEKMMEYYTQYSANIHRGSYAISQKASDEYFFAKQKVAKWIHASQVEEIIFTSGSTASANLFAMSFAEKYLTSQDNIILSQLEHHSNLIPWVKLSKMIGFQIQFLPFDRKTFQIDPKILKTLINSDTKLISLTYISNTLGTIIPIKEITIIAHQQNIPVCVDLAQAVSHISIDVQDLGIDFAFFSGHKIFGPTGIGVFYAKKAWLKKLPPFFYGGGMVETVSSDILTFREIPEKFEAGTPPIAEAIGLGKSIDYIENIGFETIQKIEHYLIQEWQEQFHSFLDIIFFTPVQSHIPIFSFLINNIHPHDIASFLEEKHISLRTGKHCTEPLIDFLGISSTIRASLSIYNNADDIYHLKKSLIDAKEFFYGN